MSCSMIEALKVVIKLEEQLRLLSSHRMTMKTEELSDANGPEKEL